MRKRQNHRRRCENIFRGQKINIIKRIYLNCKQKKLCLQMKKVNCNCFFSITFRISFFTTAIQFFSLLGFWHDFDLEAGRSWHFMDHSDKRIKSMRRILTGTFFDHEKYFHIYIYYA